MHVNGSELTPRIPATESALMEQRRRRFRGEALAHSEFMGEAGALVPATKPMSAETATSAAMLPTDVSVSGSQPGEPLGLLVVARDGGAQRRVPIFDQLFVGRECAGISDSRRLVIDDPEISRTHLEIRLDAAGDQAFVIDTSSNGTSLNGVRLERAVPLPIRAGDEIRISDVTLRFCSDRFTTVARRDPQRTQTRIGRSAMVMVVGDIVNYSAISQMTNEAVMAGALHRLWHQLGGLLRTCRGTLSYYAGDALLAVWELNSIPDAATLGIDFVLSANRLVEDLGPELPLRDPDGSPIRMGWGVVQGMAALAPMTRSVDAVIGDATNVAFRLAGLAGRQRRAAVMVTSAVRHAAAAEFSWGEGEPVVIKGRRGMETVFPVIARKPCRTA